MIEITRAEYVELIRKAEKVAILKRIVAADGYIHVGDIIAVLGIEEDGDEDGVDQD